MDYCFFTEGVDAKETEHTEATVVATIKTVLLMVETLCHSLWAYPVQSKGAAEQWVIEQIAEDLETVGLANERIIIKAVQENSITDVQRAVARLRKDYGTGVEQSRVGESNSNGKVERAIQDFKGLTRTLRSALTRKIGSRVKLSDTVVPWMVRHAAHLINVSRVHTDGRTAWQRMKGRRSNIKFLRFGEAVLFKIPKTNKGWGSLKTDGSSFAGWGVCQDLANI